MTRQQEEKKAVQRAIKRAGGVENLPDAPDGPYLARFNANALGAALDQECARAKIMGWPKITLHMDVADAKKLAAILKDR